jgi:oligopeptidase A
MLSIPAIEFSSIDVSTIVPRLEALINENRQKIAALLEAHKEKNIRPTWVSLAQPIEDMNDRLEQFWSPISHLHAVADNETLRKVYEECIPKLTAYATELGQNQQLCEAWKSLSLEDLDQEQRMTLDHTLRDFRLSGVDLPDEKRQQFAELRQQLAALTTQFSNHVLDATQAISVHITDEKELQGLPETALALYRQRAQAKQLDGWLIGLDMPAYLPVMQYAENRELREKLYRAYTTRASEVGPNAGEFDNGPLMKNILALRHQLAEVLGFSSYAELSLASKMADTPTQVLEFLQQLADQSHPQALDEYAQLQAFAIAELKLDELAPWDVPFVTEKLRLARYDLSQELLRPYFPVDRVLNGLFAIVGRLFDVQFKEIKHIDRWHEDVRFFELQKNKQTIAFTYLDLYSREGKRGGAWMADARIRRRLSDGSTQLPIAFLTCNFSPPETGKPALLTHDEVTTLFHEFGHGLHHMLTTVDVAAVSGINGVPWDAVELPSQFLENWCWEPQAIELFSAHYETGEPLPQILLDKMLAAKHFQSAMQMMRQLEFALFDLRIHAEYDLENPDFIYATLDDVRKKVSVYPLPEWNRFANSFSHIFAGGYAAGYYSYKWAEVLSADAFSRFEEEGVFNPETGQDYLDHILSRGGSIAPADLFRNFRGREPSTDALLRHSGIAYKK